MKKKMKNHPKVRDRHTLANFLSRLSSNYKEHFQDDGSIEFREFIKHLEKYRRDESILTNFYSYELLRDGVNKFYI